ncbi:MAG TPA: hypothetical protein VF762_20460 [Blastocatellia bacterium]
MGQIEYLNFDLLIERNGNGCYARGFDSPGGEASEFAGIGSDVKRACPTSC